MECSKLYCRRKCELTCTRSLASAFLQLIAIVDSSWMPSVGGFGIAASTISRGWLEIAIEKRRTKTRRSGNKRTTMRRSTKQSLPHSPSHIYLSTFLVLLSGYSSSVVLVVLCTGEREACLAVHNTFSMNPSNACLFRMPRIYQSEQVRGVECEIESKSLETIPSMCSFKKKLLVLPLRYHDKSTNISENCKRFRAQNGRVKKQRPKCCTGIVHQLANKEIMLIMSS